MKENNDRKNKGDILAERFLDFAVLIIKLVNALPIHSVINYCACCVMPDPEASGA